MNTCRNYLAMDLGAESGRAILGQFDGDRLTLSEMHRFSNTPVRLPDGLHWDALRLFHEIKTGLGATCQHVSGNIDGVGIDTWGVDFGLLDSKGSLLSNPFHYRDNRTDGMVEAAFERVSREAIFAQTGIQFMQINTLFQLFSMAKIGSPVLDMAKTFLTMPDLFNYWLTGRKVSEFTNATTTQCYNPVDNNWAFPMIQELGIPRHIFPELVEPGQILGPLLTEMAEELCISHLSVIAPACHDTGSAVASVPGEGENYAWISSGTWSIMGVTVDKPVINPQSLDFNLTNEGGVDHTFRLCKNIMGLWLVQECRRFWQSHGESFSYDEITQMAAAASPWKSIINPDAVDFLKPGDMPGRIQTYCQRTGQQIPESKGEIVRCALDSIALKYRWVLERLEDLLDRQLNTIHIVGGGTKNRLLSQITADCTGRTVITGPVEATAVGNLLTQAIALGELQSLDDIRAIVCRSFEVHTFEPNGRRDQYDDVYQRFLTLL
jgi:rhamnulokinase